MADTTKANLYIAAIFILAIFSIMIVNISTSYASKQPLTGDNLAFVNLFSSIYFSSNLTKLSGTQVAAIINQDQINESGEIISTDQFSIPKYTETKLTATPSFFKLIYNFPTILLAGVGFKDKIVFNSYINVLGYIIFISLIILGVKLIFNGGNS